MLTKRTYCASVYCIFPRTVGKDGSVIPYCDYSSSHMYMDTAIDIKESIQYSTVLLADHPHNLHARIR